MKENIFGWYVVPMLTACISIGFYTKSFWAVMFVLALMIFYSNHN